MLLPLLLLAQAAGAQSLGAQSRGWHTLLRLEASTLMLAPLGGAGQEESFAVLEPTVVVDGGAQWGVHLGAGVSLRLWGGEAGAGRVRREDWDSLSDWGQLVRAFTLGGDTSPVALWVGELEDYSLLSGHLVRRYSNRIHPDYHPAGAFLTSTLGPLYLEAFSSDVLAPRLMGAQVEVDLVHVLTGAPQKPGRYTLGLSVVRDWGDAGRRPAQAHVDAAAVLVERPGLELHLLGGWGGHLGEPRAWGAVAGVGVDALTTNRDMKLRLEARRQRGGFRQGYFGPGFELERELSVTRGLFPEGFSAYGEVELEWDEVRLGGLRQRHLLLSLGAEVFTWGRVEVAGRLGLQLAQRRLEVAVSGQWAEPGQPGAWHVYSGQVRWRFAGALYTLGQGGMRLNPGGEEGLRPVAFASLGLGVEHAR
ncbi:MAG TPA: hypothetical protein VNA24_03365 [Hyalangium sp.]|nr:hypothetical protein [Hyalangium sp.]